MKSRVQRIGTLSLICLELSLAYALLPGQVAFFICTLLPFSFVLFSILRGHGTKNVQDEDLGYNSRAASTPVEHETSILTSQEPELAGNKIINNLPEIPTTREPVLKNTLTVYNIAIPEFFRSIVVYLNKTSEPMSETLLNLKTGITSFLSGIHKTRDEFEGTTKLDDVNRCINLLRNHITEITSENNRSCTKFASEIDTLSIQMTSITDFLTSISDIAARVHVLSINASIEAARAGQHGRGFKVIANEIQKLAHETQTFVSTISETLNRTNTAFGSLKKSMKDNQEIIARQTSEDSSTYEEISSLLSNHLADIRDMYRQVIEYVETVDIDITTLSPITMLHAIITQEIENLATLWTDFSELVRIPDAGEETTVPDLDTISIIERIRSKLTTSRELTALETAVRTLGLDDSLSVRKNETTIEFF